MMNNATDAKSAFKYSSRSSCVDSGEDDAVIVVCATRNATSKKLRHLKFNIQFLGVIKKSQKCMCGEREETVEIG